MRRLAPLRAASSAASLMTDFVELVARVVVRVAECLADTKLVLSQALGDVLDAQALLGERLRLPDERDLG